MFDSSRGRAVLLLAITFVVGGLAGAGIDRTVAPATDASRRPNHAIGVSENDRIPMPLEQLGLSDDERTRLRAIARRWRPRANESFEEVRRKVSELENGMFAEMLCALPQNKRDQYLQQLQANHYADAIIAKRFALIRAKQCGQISD